MIRSALDDNVASFQFDIFIVQHHGDLAGKNNRIVDGFGAMHQWVAAVLAEGKTTIDNAAREPEISDLCEFLVAMGADISGIGTSTLVINGVDQSALRPVQHHTVPDRIQAATYIAAVAVSGS